MSKKDKDLKQVEQRIQINELKDRVKDLEEWKDKRYQSNLNQNNRIFELERKQHELEEWKRKQSFEWQESSGFVWYNTHTKEKYNENSIKIIDKQVWEDIKRNTANIQRSLFANSNAGICHDLGLLEMAIKKIDKDFCVGDKD